jgi:hypothetical protein
MVVFNNHSLLCQQAQHSLCQQAKKGRTFSLQDYQGLLSLKLFCPAVSSSNCTRMSFSSLYSLQPPKCKATLFLSSSSADCKVEREVLYNCILPRLRADHINDDIDISISDMRYFICHLLCGFVCYVEMNF